MPTPAKKPATTPIPVQLSATEFAEILSYYISPCPSCEAVLRDVKLATSSGDEIPGVASPILKA